MVGKQIVCFLSMLFLLIVVVARRCRRCRRCHVDALAGYFCYYCFVAGVPASEGSMFIHVVTIYVNIGYLTQLQFE